MRSLLNKINLLLISYFGVPPRAKRKPNPLNILIGTILSQNTNDNNSFRAYKNLKDKFQTWEEVLILSHRNLGKEINVAGLASQKAKTILDLLKYLHRTSGKLSLDYLKNKKDEDILRELTSIRGIGIKTASCVLLFSLRRNVCPVDTHVHRTLNRIGAVKTSSPEKTFYAINNSLPKNSAHTIHTNLILLGREICHPKKPLCVKCPLSDICKYESKNFLSPKEKKKNKFLLLDAI